MVGKYHMTDKYLQRSKRKKWGSNCNRRVVWNRLHNHRANLASRLSKQKEQYLALRQELNPRMTQAKSHHEPLFRDKVVRGGVTKQRVDSYYTVMTHVSK